MEREVSWFDFKFAGRQIQGKPVGSAVFSIRRKREESGEMSARN
jgi:hypothetical protein